MPLTLAQTLINFPYTSYTNFQSSFRHEVLYTVLGFGISKMIIHLTI